MCRSKARGGRRCAGRGGGRSLNELGAVPAGGGASAAAADPVAAMSPEMRRAMGCDTPEGAERFRRLSAAREGGYTGPVDQDGNRVAAGTPAASTGPRERGPAGAADAMRDTMREWRGRDVPPAPPSGPMDPQLAAALGCDTPEGLAHYERGRALREAGYSGPLDSGNRIPDPDDPANADAIGTLAALAQVSR